jgi:RimJ/RimL family protein N-acetyltransferase
VRDSAKHTPRITRLTESDWELFAEMRLRALTEAFGRDGAQYRHEAAFTAEQWRRRLREHAQFAAHLNDRPIGLIAAARDSADTVYLYSLWLDPNARGRGLARRLVGAALDWARRHRARTVTLRVATDNAAARAVYEEFGFTEAPDDTSDGEIALTLTVS